MLNVLLSTLHPAFPMESIPPDDNIRMRSIPSENI